MGTGDRHCKKCEMLSVCQKCVQKMEQPALFCWPTARVSLPAPALSPDCRRRETRAEFDRGLEGMRSQPSISSFGLSDAKVKLDFVSLKTHSSIMIIKTTLVESASMKIVPQLDRPHLGRQFNIYFFSSCQLQKRSISIRAQLFAHLSPIPDF